MIKNSYHLIDVRPISGSVGAEIHGLDLKKEIAEEQFREVRSAFGVYGVIFFRDQNLSPEEEITFAERWGKININRFFSNLDGYPKIAMVLKEPDQKKILVEDGIPIILMMKSLLWDLFCLLMKFLKAEEIQCFQACMLSMKTYQMD